MNAKAKIILASLIATSAFSSVSIGNPDNYSVTSPVYSAKLYDKDVKPFYATARPWEKPIMKWASKFSIREIGGIEDLEWEIEENGLVLDKNDGINIAYEWQAGFYNTEKKQNEPFFKEILSKPQKYLLNWNTGEHPMNDSDYYYDVCNADFIKKRADYLIKKAQKLGIGGYFFDWSNQEHMEENRFYNMKIEFEKRHPKKSYAECIGMLYDKLRKAGLKVVSNQAFRNPELLDHVDVDMTESYISTNEDGETIYDPLDRIVDLVKWIKSLENSHNVKNILFMDYTVEKDKKEAFFVQRSILFMFGSKGYLEVVDDRMSEPNSGYFINIGQPIEEAKRIDFENGTYAYYGYTENGFAIAMEGIPEGERMWLEINSRGYKKAYDYYSGNWIEAVNGKFTIPVSGSNLPVSGRFLKFFK